MSEVKQFVAADRFVDAQHWWIASELCRRHPELLLLENAIDGYGNVIEALGAIGDRKLRIGFSRVAGIQVQGVDGFCVPPPALLDEANPHAILKRLERASGVRESSRTVGTTRQNIGYRVISQTLAMTINSRHSWTLRGERPDDPHVGASVDWLGEAANWDSVKKLRRRWGADAAVGDLYPTPRAQAWLLMRDLEPVAVFDLYGCARMDGGTVDCIKKYRSSAGDIASVACEIASALK